MASFKGRISERDIERILQEEQDERKVWEAIERFNNQEEEDN